MSLNSKLPEGSLLQGLKNGDKNALSRLYSTFLDKIPNNLKDEFPLVDLIEIDSVYTDSCIIISELAKSNKSTLTQSDKLITLDNEENALYYLLRRICRNKLIDFIRKQKVNSLGKRVNLSIENSSSLNDENEYEYFINELQSNSENDEEYFITELQSNSENDNIYKVCLEKSMNEISEVCKTIFFLRYVEKLSWEETGKELERNAETLRKVTWPRCLENLKKLIEVCVLSNN